MKLWSLQPNEIALKLERGERFVTDPERAECYNLDDSFRDSYHWLSSFMEERIPRPADVLIPVWAWHTAYGVQKKPDRRRGLWSGYPFYETILELEVPEEKVLLTDFDDWHCVLNNFPIFTKDEETNWPAGYDEWELPIYDDEFKLRSWRRVARADGEFVQACFWSIEPEYLVKVHRFRRRK